MNLTNNPPTSSLKQMSALSAWSASLHLLWMTRLVWTHFLNSCSGFQPWSVLVKKTQITAWWVWTQPNNAVFRVSVSIVQGSFIPGSISISYHFNLNLTHLFACISHKQPQQHNFSPLTPEGYWQCDGVWWPTAGCAVVRKWLQQPSSPHSLHQTVQVQWLDQRCDEPLYSHSAN